MFSRILSLRIFDLNRKLLPNAEKQNKENFVKKKIGDSEIVKTCDELDQKAIPLWSLPMPLQHLLREFWFLHHVIADSIWKRKRNEEKLIKVLIICTVETRFKKAQFKKESWFKRDCCYNWFFSTVWFIYLHTPVKSYVVKQP